MFMGYERRSGGKTARGVIEPLYNLITNNFNS